MLSKYIKILFKYSFILIWIFVAAEAFMRVFEPQPILPRYVEAGDFGIRVNMPNQVYKHQSPDFEVIMRTNSKGIRSDVEYAYEKPDGTKRIVILGDSFGMGYEVELEDTFTQVMRRELMSTLDQKVEVINLSVSGYGTAEQLLMLQNEGIKYQPDLVLVTWHDTDPDDNIRSNLFKVENNQLVRRNATYLPGIEIREFLYQFSFYRWLAGESHFYNWFRGWAANTIKDLLVKRNDPPEKSQVTDEVAKEIENKQPSRKEVLSLFLLKEIKKVAEENQANLLILEIPTRKTRVDFQSSLNEFLRDEFNVVSPIVELQKSAEASHLIYHERSHGHFTPLGCRIIGELLAKRILKDGLL
ncbi:MULTISPECIES: SGNH/GDSL hydrolase family protein [unclassified Methylophaga]|uniref:SGNH/GDSL hydrolase family protein n=1 Tax=unclassified Methylophaga TaxID=2629249 RepID=UPI000C95DB1D|nr:MULTISPECIES: SGNH/GDSL hydrolase family protein [unclassified Methylophaga]MAK67301.1 hypothetical protein [Methylophaga sp.]MAY18338.1 hypothetical protein [Methylophaga sp.]HCD05805.1 hypothetical protein [Methylophaga sp.]